MHGECGVRANIENISVNAHKRELCVDSVSQCVLFLDLYKLYRIWMEGVAVCLCTEGRWSVNQHA